MNESQLGGTERGTERIEAFSDGVFAIAITLLVLEIKIPHLQGGSNLFSSLLGLWPAYFGYVLSFVMIGIYWANHHYIFKFCCLLHFCRCRLRYSAITCLIQ
jgi:uncharacterized membrane protein